MDELQTDIEPTLTVLPQPPTLLQPCKVALDYPALWHDLESVQLTALGYLHCGVFTQRQAATFARLAPDGKARMQCAPLGTSPLARLATGSPCVANKAPRKTPQTSPCGVGWFSYAHSRARKVSARTAHS